jgi:hypothetical protein
MTMVYARTPTGPWTTSTSRSTKRSKPSTRLANYPPTTKAPRCASSALRCTVACSATATARPVEMDCHVESICESCSFFVTTIEFRPTSDGKPPKDHFISNTGMSPVAKTRPLNAIAALMALGEGDPCTRMIVRKVGTTPHTNAARK